MEKYDELARRFLTEAGNVQRLVGKLNRHAGLGSSVSPERDRLIFRMALGRILPDANGVSRAAHEALDACDWGFLDAVRSQKRFDLSQIPRLERFLMTRWDARGTNPEQELFHFTPEALATVCEFAVERCHTDSIADTIRKTVYERLHLPSVKRDKWGARIVNGQLMAFPYHRRA